MRRSLRPFNVGATFDVANAMPPVVGLSDHLPRRGGPAEAQVSELPDLCGATLRRLVSQAPAYRTSSTFEGPRLRSVRAELCRVSTGRTSSMLSRPPAGAVAGHPVTGVCLGTIRSGQIRHSVTLGGTVAL